MTKPSRIVFESFCDMAVMLGFKIEQHRDKLIIFFNNDNEPADILR
jgi:hypothetical protein